MMQDELIVTSLQVLTQVLGLFKCQSAYYLHFMLIWRDIMLVQILVCKWFKSRLTRPAGFDLGCKHPSMPAHSLGWKNASMKSVSCMRVQTVLWLQTPKHACTHPRLKDCKHKICQLHEDTTGVVVGRGMLACLHGPIPAKHILTVPVLSTVTSLCNNCFGSHCWLLPKNLLVLKRPYSWVPMQSECSDWLPIALSLHWGCPYIKCPHKEKLLNWYSEDCNTANGPGAVAVSCSVSSNIARCFNLILGLDKHADIALGPNTSVTRCHVNCSNAWQFHWWPCVAHMRVLACKWT